MEQGRQYIEKLTSLTKASQFEPFRIEWNFLYGDKKEIGYLADAYYLAGETFAEKKIYEAGPLFQKLLDTLIPSIEKYPYAWGLEGERLDKWGYDFSFNSTVTSIEIGIVAKEEAWLRLGLTTDAPNDSYVYEGFGTVTGGHLSKFSLTLEKASPVSLLSFQMQATFPVRLASLVYESDLSGHNEARIVDLETLQVQQSAEVITVLFGKPIFAKRLTFVLAQDNAKTNTYYLTRSGEDFSYLSTEEDASALESLLNQEGQTMVYKTEAIYSDTEIKDWSEERKAAYIKWRALKLASLEG